jgi:hypothetical protein
MINVQEVVENRLDENVILITSYDYEADKVYFLVITKEGTKHTTTLNCGELTAYNQKDFESRVEDAAHELVRDIAKIRKLKQAQSDLARAQSSLDYIKNNQPEIYARGTK